MHFLIITLFLISGFNQSWAEDFSNICAERESLGKNVSLFNCSQTSIPKSIQKLLDANNSIGKLQCKSWHDRSRVMRNFDFESLKVFDRDKEKAVSLACYCGDKIGKNICSSKEDLDKKTNILLDTFEVRAWSVLVNDLISLSQNRGNGCIEKVKKESKESGCFEKLEGIHSSSKIHSKSFSLSKTELERFEENNLNNYFDSLSKDYEVSKGMVKEGLSYFPSSSQERGDFLIKNDLKEADFYGLRSNSYEKKIKDIGKGQIVESFLELLRSDSSVDEKLKSLSKKGELFFSLTASGLDEEQVESRIVLASHPDLSWLFNLNVKFSNEDNKEVKRKLKELSQIAKENKFSSLRELKSKYYENKNGGCEQTLKNLDRICKIDSEHILRASKNVIDQGESSQFFGFVTASSDETALITQTLSELDCFDFKDLPEDKDISHLLISERNPSMNDVEFFLRSTESSIIEANVESAINKVEGFENIAERIGKEKVQAGGSEVAIKKVENLENDFKDFLSGLKLPNGSNFNYPLGMDPAEAVANYKSEVYRWADDAVEKRISNIQGETDRIVNSDLPPLEKKKKLKELLSEVERLNKGDFLEEIYKEKQNIGEYIARYEDKKKDWEAQYGEEAKENPKAVQAVAPPRSKTRSAGQRGSNSYKNIAGNSSNYVGGSDRAASSSNIDNATAYIPPAPSVPFAQGSLMTRIVPKDEFQNNTVKASLLAKHKGYPIAVLDEKALKVELYTPKGGTSYKLQETLTISEAEARGYVFPDDVKKLVEGYKKDKSKGRAPASYIDYEPTKKDLLEKKKKLEKLQSLSDVMERQGVPRRARVVRLNAILDNF